MQFWTIDEFKTFLEQISDKPHCRAAFLPLYYTGLRIGELLALEYGDINFTERTITVNKTFQRVGKEDIITPPKTPRSNRTVTLPQFLVDELKSYTEKLYGLNEHYRLFPYTKSFFMNEIKRGTRTGNVKRIRIHDLRHSHASLLIELGFSALAIADFLFIYTKVGYFYYNSKTIVYCAQLE